jgi:hypothetical protein
MERASSHAESIQIDEVNLLTEVMNDMVQQIACD